jgi:hypothetical protein
MMLRQKKGLLTTVFEEKHSCVGNDLLIDLNDSGLTFDENADYLAEFGKY